MARWCIRVVVGGALLLMATSLIVANSPMVSSKVRAEIAAATGCLVEMDRARIDLDGRVEIKNLRLSIPGVAGPEALLLSAEEAEIDLSWAAALSWSGLSAVKPTSIRLEKPLFRLSQSLDDGSLNLAGLATGGAGGSGGGAAPGGGAVAAVPSIPTVNVQDGRIEFAEHSAKQARFEVLNTIHVAGAFASNADGSYRIRMQEIGRLAPPRIEGEPQLPRGMILDGRVDLQRAEAVLRLLNVPLEAWPPESVPTAYRETWRRLRIQGRIRETMFEYDRVGGVRLSIWPEAVAMDIPVPAESDVAADNLSLGSVNGVLTLSRDGLAAELQGVFEEQTKPVHVKFRTDGADMNAPLVCEIWGDGLTLARNPGFLPYIPPTAREFFVFFSGPTGEVDAKVTIARGPPVDGAPAPVVVTDGRLNVRNGTAAFHLFPYPFHNMEVKATFDENHLNLLDIRGDGPTGAKLRASSQAAPMTDDARVDVSVYVTGVPVDEHLRAAMPGSRKQLLDVLFNEERYAELLEAGLVRPAGSPEAEGDAPEFAMGGVCEIDVTVVRPFGKDVEWSTDVVVRIAEAGVVPKPFPYPIIARDVELRITDKDGTLTRGTFAGLRGGRAELSAHVQLTEGDANVLKPKLDIAAFDVPVDDLLIHAVPDDEHAGEPGAVSAKAILRRLAISGNVDCTAKIRDAGDGSEDIDYDVAVDLKGIDARPRQTEGDGDGTRMLVSGATGRIRVTPSAVQVEELGGRLVSERVEAAGSGVAEAESCGEFVLALDARIVPPQPQPEVGPPEPGVIGAIGLSVDVRGLDLVAPLPSLLRVFNEEVAGVLSEIRQERSPAGRVDATIRLDLAEGAQKPTVAASFSGFEDVSFDAIAGRVCLLDVMGGASFVDRDDPDPRRRSTLGFESFAANIEYAGESAGSIALDGRFSLDPDAAEDELLERTMADAELSVRLLDARFESRLVTDVLALGLAESTLASWSELKVAGRFDAEFELVGEPVEIVGMIGPRSIGFERAGGRVELPAVVGHVTFHAAADADRPGERTLEGRIEGLACRDETWSADATGVWRFAADEGLELETALAFECEQLSEQLFAVLPEAAVDALRAVDLRIDGGFSMPAARLVARIPSQAAGPGPAEGPQVRFEAQARFAGASADLGVPLRECDGEVSIGVESIPGEEAAVLIELAAPTLTIAGIGMTGASAVLESDESGSGGLSVPFFTARCHGGRIWGSATIGAEEHEKRAFAADVLAAGVLFAPLLDELGAMKVEEESPPVIEEARAEPESPHEPMVRPPDRTRGQADLWLTMSGVTGDASSRIGRGAIRVANGDVLRLPVVLPLVQMSNLMLPSRDRFGYLQAEFHVRGQTVLFESIAVLSDSVSLMGDGTATLPDLTLDMRFNSRSNTRIPLLSDVYEALRDEILTTRVRGTVASPEIRSETLTTTRGILDGLFDPGRGVQGSIRNDDAARREELRARDVQRSERPLPPTTMPSLPTGVDG
jgi:hypothetical protein